MVIESYHSVPEGFNSLDLSNEQSKAWWYLVSPKHAEISRIIYGGAAYGGKSTLIALWLDYMCQTYPESRYYLGRETLKDIKESILLTFFDIAKLTGSKFKYNEQKSKITYQNGSEIFLLETFNYPADPNFDRFGSREYTAGAIEEGVTTVRRAADILLSRTRYKHVDFGLVPKQLITLNPGDGWIKDEIVKPTLEEKGPNRKSDVFVRATLDSNPNKQGAAGYRQNLENNLGAFDRARLLDGDWDAKLKTGAEYFKEFKQDRHVVKNLRDKYDSYFPLHVSFDENVHPYITCEIWQIHMNERVKIAMQLFEICKKPPDNSRKKVCAAIIEQFSEHKGGMYIYGDASSWKNETTKDYDENFFTEIQSYLIQFHPQLRVPTKNPPVLSRAGFINLIFEKDYQQVKIEIDSECKLSINDYAYALEDANGGILKKKVTDPETGIQYEKQGHHCDAFCYFICEAFLSEFNIYLSGGITPVYEIGSDRKHKFER